MIRWSDEVKIKFPFPRVWIQTADEHSRVLLIAKHGVDKFKQKMQIPLKMIRLHFFTSGCLRGGGAVLTHWKLQNQSSCCRGSQAVWPGASLTWGRVSDLPSTSPEPRGRQWLLKVSTLQARRGPATVLPAPRCCLPGCDALHVSTSVVGMCTEKSAKKQNETKNQQSRGTNT